MEGMTEDRLHIGFDFTTPGNSCALQLFTYQASYPYAFSPDIAAGIPFRQAYGQYKANFVDVRADVDDKPGRAGDDDDTNLGIWPVAIEDNTHVQELYLISKDKKKRLFLRRRLIARQDFDGNGQYSGFEQRYAIQMLQLKGFDAGQNHDFNAAAYSWVYDGVIDTWACDADAGYVCNGAALGAPYTSYNLPNDIDDGWVNITSDDLSVTNWNFVITPVKDPELSRWEQDEQLNPFITVSLSTSMYGNNRYQKIGKKQIDRVTFDIQTSFNVKTHY